MKKVAILYIALGRYDIFWKDFYDSSEQYFLNDFEKEYFVFTDSKNITYQEQENIHIIDTKSREWPFNTLMRFDMFLTQEEKLKTFDYMFFFNANMQFVDYVGDEVLPNNEEESGLVLGLHPGFYNKKPNEFTYDRNPKSLAYIPYNQGKYYLAGCLNGGTSEAFLKLCHVCRDNINKDLENGVIALWHDESHINKYVIDKNVKILPCNYLYPPFELSEYKNNIKIISVNKYDPKYGGIKYLRGLSNSKQINIISSKNRKRLNKVCREILKIFPYFMVHNCINILNKKIYN